MKTQHPKFIGGSLFSLSPVAITECHKLGESNWKLSACRFWTPGVHTEVPAGQAPWCPRMPLSCLSIPPVAWRAAFPRPLHPSLCAHTAFSSPALSPLLQHSLTWTHLLALFPNKVPFWGSGVGLQLVFWGHNSTHNTAEEVLWGKHFKLRYQKRRTQTKILSFPLKKPEKELTELKASRRKFKNEIENRKTINSSNKVKLLLWNFNITHKPFARLTKKERVRWLMPGMKDEYSYQPSKK